VSFNSKINNRTAQRDVSKEKICQKHLVATDICLFLSFDFYKKCISISFIDHFDDFGQNN